MVPWDDKVAKFTYTPQAGGEAGALFVPTVETTRLSYFLDSMVANRSDPHTAAMHVQKCNACWSLLVMPNVSWGLAFETSLCSVQTCLKC